MALTFSTLLSSQGADTQERQPQRSFVFPVDCPARRLRPDLAVVPGAERKLRARTPAVNHGVGGFVVLRARPGAPGGKRAGQPVSIRAGLRGRSRVAGVSGARREGVGAPRDPSETEESVDPDGQAGPAGHLAHGQEHPGHERGPVVGVVPEGERLPRGAEEHLLVGDES